MPLIAARPPASGPYSGPDPFQHLPLAERLEVAAFELALAEAPASLWAAVWSAVDLVSGAAEAPKCEARPRIPMVGS
jgi:hypothetical protein